MNFLLRFVISSVSVYVSAQLPPGVHVSGFKIALLVALVLGIINVTLKPILILLTLPATILTLGLFLFIINAAMILLTSVIVSGFQVENFWWALLFSLVLSIISYILQKLIE